MGEEIGAAIPFALGIAVSPVPIIGVVLMLGTRAARWNGPAFALGWLAGLTCIGTLILLVSDGASGDDNGPTAPWVSAVKAALGLACLAIAIRQWRSRPRRGEQPPMPRWMQALDAFTWRRAAVFGVGFAAANPKNILLAAGAVGAIDGAQPTTQVVGLAVFVAIGTLGVGVPVAVYFALGTRSERFLEALKRWMSAHNATITALIFFVIAAKLISDAIREFAA